MPWKITPIEHKTFGRNPLVVVTSQLRFHPIVLIKQGKGIGDFQDKLRHKFPAYSEVETTNITIGRPQGGSDVALDTQREKQYIFATENGKTRIVLGSASLSIENKSHEQRAQLVEEFQSAISALREVYGEISTLRIGLRYVNAVSKETLQQDLGRTVNWTDIISHQFIRLPDPADTDALFYTEITSQIGQDGLLTIRYGLLKDTDNQVRFRIDSDRYLNAPYDISTTKEKLIAFSDDIFSLYMMAAGPALQEWMSNGKGQS